MANTTDFLHLVKPELSDYVNPEVFSENFERIDNGYRILSDSVSKLSVSEDNNNKKMNAEINNIKKSISKFKIVSSTSVVATFTNGTYKFPFSYVGITSRPPCIVLTPSSGYYYMSYDWDSSASEIVIKCWDKDGSGVSGAVRFSMIVSVPI